MADVYATWMAISGSEAKIDPIQIAEWPAWFRDDIRFILSECAYAREQEDKKKADAPKPNTPQPKRKGMKRR